MFKYMSGFALFSPLIGIILMEAGAYGFSVGRVGHPNGATIAYTLYLLLFLATFRFLVKGAVKIRESVTRTSDPDLLALHLVVLVLNLFFLAVMLFFFGGIRIVSGDVTKESFRIGLGTFGSVAYWISLYFAPAVLAYLSFRYSRSPRDAVVRYLLVANFILVFLIGSSWGFKSTAVMVLTPSLLILYWRITLRQLTVLFLGLSTSLIFFSMVFDRSGNVSETLAVLYVRATVIQGDVPWLIWDLQQEHESFPPYARTFLPVVGDNLFTLISGISKDDYAEWVDYHYDLMLTHVAGYPYWGIEAGHNVTGTPFAEGLIASGSPGFLLFAILGGSLLAFNFRLLQSAIRSGSGIAVALAATYFCFKLFPWLYSGGLLSLIHVSTVIGIGLTALLIRLVEGGGQLLGLVLGSRSDELPNAVPSA